MKWGTQGGRSEKVTSGPEAGLSVIHLGTTLKSHCPTQHSLVTCSYLNFVLNEFNKLLKSSFSVS